MKLLCMFFLIYVFGASSDGLFFEDSEKTILIGAISGTSHVVIPQTVEIIRGGEKETDGFAFSIRSTLVTVDFNNDGDSLKTIEGYAFASTKLKSINLSLCKNLQSIGYSAFEKCKSTELYLPLKGNISILLGRCFQFSEIKSVLLPSSIKEISDYGFYYCQSLSEFIFEKNSQIEKIGWTTFEHSSLESIKLPKTLQSISQNAFVHCYNLIEISIEFGNTKYVSESGILYTKNYENLVIFPPGLQAHQNLTVKDGVRIFEFQSFRSAQISGVTIPSTVKLLETQVFEECYELAYINISDNVETIKTGCFMYNAFSFFRIPSKITVLPTRCYQGCRKLSKIIFNENIVTINGLCFASCDSLVSMELPDGLKKIESSCFQGCKNLIEVWLPQSIEYLGGGLFEGCHRSLKVRFKSQGQFETDDQYIIYSDNMTNVVQIFALPQDPNIVLPDTVTSISGAAFASSLIESIQLSPNLKTIGSRSFASCPNIKSISFPSTLISINSEIFMDSSIISIDLAFITLIPSKAFYGCKSLKSITIPSTVTSILDSAFQKATSLTNVTFTVDCSLQNISKKAFAECSSLTCLSIPPSVSFLEEEMISGKSVQKICIENGSNLSSIPYAAFMNSIRLSEVIFSNTTRVLGEYSLALCTSLRSLSIAPSIVVLDDFCLSGCTSLEEIIIETNSLLETISNSAFNGLSSLASITVHPNCKGFVSDSNSAVLFNKNKSSIIKYCCKNPLARFSIPSTVSSIGWCCFEGAENLMSILIPQSIHSIGFRSFAGCVNLTSIVIPNSVSLVGDQAFDGCTSLKCGSVKYPKAIKKDLLRAGIKEEALEKCITRIFSIREDRFDSIQSILLSSSLMNDNSSDVNSL